MTDERKYVTSQQEYGYLAESEPTDAQLRLQDEIDTFIQELFDKMEDLYSAVEGRPTREIEHDIQKITTIREEVEELLGLEDIY